MFLPGLRLVRREVGRLQLGIDPPHRVLLPDHPDVRRLVADLAGELPLGALSEVAARALDSIVAADLLVDSTIRPARSTMPVLVEAAPAVSAAAVDLLIASGGTVADSIEQAAVVLIVTAGEVARERVDELVRAGMPHLLLAGHPGSHRLGPFVAPGVTACLRCVDAAFGEDDPRRPIVVAQAAQTRPLGSNTLDPPLLGLALGWAVQEILSYLDGQRPTLWSATVEIDPALALSRRDWLRHPHCGCSWGDALTAG